MDFINDVDLEAAAVGREIYLVAKFADIFHAGVGGGINFYEVEEGAGVDGFAMVAGIVGAL